MYRIGEDQALVLTVDFFTPIVDDPRVFGEIAAANSLSDVYAMGGEPFAALNICGFPANSEDLPLSILGEILEGGAAKTREAGVAILGGHTVDDAEPKYGLAVVGRVDPERILSKAGAQPGDRLVLTKPIGTGILTTALKQGKIGEAEIAEAVRVMSTLNRDAARVLAEFDVRAATDVTGFGLLGHLREMLREGSIGARLAASAVPLLDGARELAEDGVAPGGTRKNLAAAAEDLLNAGEVSEIVQLLLADAQTSGGLLLAVSPEEAGGLRRRLEELGTPAAADVGEITDAPGIRIET